MVTQDRIQVIPFVMSSDLSVIDDTAEVNAEA